MSSRSPITTSAAAAARGCASASNPSSAPHANVANLMCLLPLDPEKLVQHRHLAREFRRAKAIDDAAVLHDVETVGQWCRETEVLFHHDDGVPAAAQLLDGARQRLHDHWRESFGDLIQQEQF